MKIFIAAWEKYLPGHCGKSFLKGENASSCFPFMTLRKKEGGLGHELFCDIQ